MHTASLPPLARHLHVAIWLLTACGLLWLLAALPIAYLDRQDRWMAPDSTTHILIKLWLYWAVWAIIPFTLACLLQIWRTLARPQPRAMALSRMGVALIVLAIGAWSSLIEPRLLRVQTHTFTAPAHTEPLRIALIADLHLGLFWRSGQLADLVKKINTLNVDAVMVAGDWTYEPPHDLRHAFAPLAQLNAPIYGVMGNHDLQAPGGNQASALHDTLTSLGVHLLDGQSMQLKSWQLVGIGDLWGDQPQRHIQEHLTLPFASRIILTHQPDTAARFPPHAGFLTLSGHTHGGQIRLPLLTQKVLEGSMQNPWYLGRYELPQGGLLFVTSGIGTIGLPARLGVMPSIDVLEIQPATK